MSAPEQNVCEHDWQPIPGWFARYRCATCRVVGYKPAAVCPKHCHRTQIVPYRCEATSGGKRCGEPAVHSVRGKRFKCAAHANGGTTSAARKALQLEVVSGGHQVSAAGHEVLTAAREVLTAGHEVLTASDEVLTTGREVLTAGHEVLTGARVVLTAGHEVLTRGREVLTAGHEVLTEGDHGTNGGGA